MLSPAGDNSHLTILPIYSGYRDTDNLKFILACRYQDVIKLIDSAEPDPSHIEDYSIAFPRVRITSLHIFNDHLHASVSSSYSATSSSEQSDTAILPPPLTN